MRTGGAFVSLNSFDKGDSIGKGKIDSTYVVLFRHLDRRRHSSTKRRHEVAAGLSRHDVNLDGRKHSIDRLGIVFLHLLSTLVVEVVHVSRIDKRRGG